MCFGGGARLAPSGKVVMFIVLTKVSDNERLAIRAVDIAVIEDKQTFTVITLVTGTVFNLREACYDIVERLEV